MNQPNIKSVTIHTDSGDVELRHSQARQMSQIIYRHPVTDRDIERFLPAIMGYINSTLESSRWNIIDDEDMGKGYKKIEIHLGRITEEEQI